MIKKLHIHRISKERYLDYANYVSMILNKLVDMHTSLFAYSRAMLSGTVKEYAGETNGDFRKKVMVLMPARQA